MNVLALLSRRTVRRLCLLEGHLFELEARAAILEAAGDYAEADDLWSSASEIEAEYEGYSAAIVEDDVSFGTIDDEEEPGFRSTLEEQLTRLAQRVHAPEPADDWFDVTAVDAASGDVMDEVVDAAGTRWIRTLLANLDDPRRPHDSVRHCVDVRGRPCGPLMDVWRSGDGRFVGPQTLAALGGRPALTPVQVIECRVLAAVRAAAMEQGVSESRIVALTPADACDVLQDLWRARTRRPRQVSGAGGTVVV